MTQTVPPAQIDDSGLLFSQQFEDHYFSRDDGRAECAHVFIDGNDLPRRWCHQQRQDGFVVGELGFGTGLNFLETWRQWQALRAPGQMLTFVSVEAYPLTVETAALALVNWPELDQYATVLLEQWENLHSPIMMDDQTRLHVLAGDAGAMVSQFPLVDAWYLDGFSPAKNPQMWAPDLMCSLAERTAQGGTFASFTAAGWVRRNLEAAGFTVEKRAGFAHKRHMIVGWRS